MSWSKQPLNSREAGEKRAPGSMLWLVKWTSYRKHHFTGGTNPRNNDELEETVRHVFTGLLDLASSS